MKRLYRIDEAAEYLGMSRRNIYKMLAEGKLRGCKLDSYTRITREELERFVELGIQNFLDENQFS